MIERTAISEGRGIGFGRVDGGVDRRDVVAVALVDDLRVPAVRLVAAQHVLGEAHARGPGQRDAVVVVEHDIQLAQVVVARPARPPRRRRLPLSRRRRRGRRCDGRRR